jgi:hypothetical protein
MKCGAYFIGAKPIPLGWQLKVLNDHNGQNDLNHLIEPLAFIGFQLSALSLELCNALSQLFPLCEIFRISSPIRITAGFQKHLTWSKIPNKLPNSACFLVLMDSKPYFCF